MRKRCKAIWIYSTVFWGLTAMSLLLFGFAFGRVELNTLALREQYWTGQIDALPYTSGVYDRGLPYQFIKFPADMQYIDYNSTSSNGVLNLISQDSQPFTLEYTVAYRVKNTSLKTIYQSYTSNYVQMVQSAINNRILRVTSMINSDQLWLPETEDAIKDSIIQLLNSSNTVAGSLGNQLYGVQLQAFWLGSIQYINLEDYFMNSYIDNPGNSSAYLQSQSDLISTNFQISALNATINNYINQLNTTMKNTQNINYFANANLTAIMKSFGTNSSLSAMLPNISAARFLAMRNYTRIVFI